MEVCWLKGVTTIESTLSISTEVSRVQRGIGYRWKRRGTID